MRICTVVNAHGNTDVLLDTIDSITTYVGRDALVLCDGSTWESWGRDVALPVPKVQGFRHGWPRAPYRNVALGLMTLHQQHPDSDWYCYTEYDVLFASSSFKKDLKGWCVGSNYREIPTELTLVEKIARMPLADGRYLLGCCVFYNGEFIRKLVSMDFFERFLYYTNEFTKDFFPGFDEYDLSEFLYPTLAHTLGGEITGLSAWTDYPGLWRGNFKKYPLRFRPDLDPSEVFPEASILHPVKDYDNPIRQELRGRRKRHG